jgi:hypothetical protein
MANLGDRQIESCGYSFGQHACYDNTGHTGDHVCAPSCNQGHVKATWSWHRSSTERVYKAVPASIHASYTATINLDTLTELRKKETN